MRRLKSYVPIDGKFITIERCVIVADAPARAFLQSVVSHSGKLACSYCRIEGVWVSEPNENRSGRICFPFMHYESRTNEDYIAMNENNQRGPSPLLGVVDFVQDFPPDYMHAVCLGVVKRMCSYFFCNVKGLRLPCKLSLLQKQQLSDLISQISPCLPVEFHRKLRPVTDFENYKAVEFRLIVIYLAPILFKRFLPKPYYEHILLLHFSIYCFVSCTLSRELFHQAKCCLELFCERAEVLYRNRLQSYNTHILSHIPEFVKANGPLDSWSAFIFENYNGIVKRRLKCTSGMFQQTLNNLSIIRNLFSNVKPTSFTFSNEVPNNCCIIEGGFVIQISEATLEADVTLVDGYVLTLKRDLYTYPYKSSLLGIGYYSISTKFVSNRVPCKKMHHYSM